MSKHAFDWLGKFLDVLIFFNKVKLNGWVIHTNTYQYALNSFTPKI